MKTTKIVSKKSIKKEINLLIDELPDDTLLVLTHNLVTGKSDNGKMTKTRKCIKLINAADLITESGIFPVRKISLMKDKYSFLDKYGGNISKSIMLPQKEKFT